MIRTYTELIQLKTFEERFEYLRLSGTVGADTFGFERYINQRFYKSYEWKHVRNLVILRDQCCDLAFEDRPIPTNVIIHHMNPITVSDIIDFTEYLLNTEYLICTSHNTHNAIHYGNESNLYKAPVERKPNDTCLWKH